MDRNNNVQMLSAILLILLCIMVISSSDPVGIFNLDADHQSGSESALAVSGPGSRAGSEDIDEDANSGINSYSLTKFATGSTHHRILGNPDGDVINLAIPPDMQIVSAGMQISGQKPDLINKQIVGERPIYVSGADFDSDGNLDIITTDLHDHRFYVLFGDGNLKFRSTIHYPTGDLPIMGTINDLNNDGNLDFATANEGSNTFTVYQNSGAGDVDGNGTFINRKDYQIGDMPRSITSADYNGDGWVDLASISSNDDQLWVNFNRKNESIAFSEPENYSLDRSPVGMTSADLNDDGHPDIMIVHVGANIYIDGKRHSNTVSILLNDGTGKFQPKVDYIVGLKPTEVLSADLNNDGWLDLLTSNQAGYNVSVLLNRGRGDGRFYNAINYSLIPRGTSGKRTDIGDVDGDGDLDIVSLCAGMNFINILKNKGDGTFEKYVNYNAGHSPLDLFLGDLDNDGDLDVTTSNVKDGTLTLVPNNGDGTFSTYEFYYVGGWPRGLAMGDIDNDDDLDLVTANYLGGSLSIRYNDGTGYFPKHFIKYIAVEPFAVIIEDLDMDGSLDMVSADEGLFELVLVYNDGNGNFTKRENLHYDIGGYPYAILYHDLNGDGIKDLITSNNGQNSLSFLWGQDNNTFTPFVDYYSKELRPFGIVVGDIDGDGDDDLVCTNLGFDTDPEYNLTFLWNDGNGTFTSHENMEVGADPVNLRLSDIDLDGDLDIVVANMGSSSVTILKNQNNNSFGERRDYPVGPEPMCVSLSDLDHDGDLDIVTANHGNDSISLMYNLGDGTFSDHEEYIVGTQPTYVVVGDFNSDTNIDIAISNLVTSTISIRLDMFYPGNISVDIGNDGSEDFKYSGKLSTDVEIPDFAETLNSYLKLHETDLTTTPNGQVILVPVKISSDIVGSIDISGLKIDYDSDNDNIPDVWETKYGLDPHDPSDAGLDADGDEYSNLEEYLGYDGKAGGDDSTDPTDPDDIPNKSEDDNDDPGWFIPGFDSGLMIASLIVLMIALRSSDRRKDKKK